MHALKHVLTSTYTHGYTRAQKKYFTTEYFLKLHTMAKAIYQTEESFLMSDFI